MPLNCLSLNVKGLNHPAKRFSLWSEGIRSKADIIGAQETHFQSDRTPKCQHAKYPHVFLSSASAKKRGVMLAIADSVSFTASQVVTDTHGRYIILLCFIDNCPYTIVNVYAPNTRQLRFLRKLWVKINKLKKGD